MPLKPSYAWEFYKHGDETQGAGQSYDTKSAKASNFK